MIDGGDDRLETLSALASVFGTASFDDRSVLDLVTRKMAERVNGLCAIMLVFEDRQRFETVAAHDTDPELLPIFRRLLQNTPFDLESDVPPMRVLRTGAPLVLPEVPRELLHSRLDEASLEALDRAKLRSAMLLPMRFQGAPVGVLLMNTHGPSATTFGERDVEFGQCVASQLAFWVANARLHLDSKRMTSRLQVLSEVGKEFGEKVEDHQGLLDLICTRLTQVLGDTCVIQLLSRDGQFLDLCACSHRDPTQLELLRKINTTTTSRAGQGLGQVLVTGQPVCIPVVDPAVMSAALAPERRALVERLHITSLMAAPLFVSGRAIGALCVGRTFPSPAFDPQDFELLVAVASHASVALTNSQLLATTRKEERERKKAQEILRRTEEQLLHAQKLEAVGRLAGGVAHDFNNILSVILSYTSMIEDGTVGPADIGESVKQIDKAGRRAAELTKQLLAFSRQQVAAPKVVDVRALIQSIAPMLERMAGEDLSFEVTTGQQPLRVFVDPSHLEQVLMNLVVNARDAMPDGGQVTLEARLAMLDDEYAFAHHGVNPGPHVMLVVSDTGVGMSKEVQGRIFEPFFTTKVVGKGTGLGLSTVFGIVKQAGGSIEVYSELGKGSTFKVYLPATEQSPSTTGATAVRPTPRGSETLLLVEDEEQLRRVATIILKREGYQVIAAANGAEALTLAASQPGTIDLLLTDVVMPGMSGRQLAERLLRERPGLKVLYMSGYTQNAIVHHRVLDDGVMLLEKPITGEVLVAKVREVLAMPR